MFEKIKGYYQKGLYKAAHLAAFVRAGVLTQEQANEIMGVI